MDIISMPCGHSSRESQIWETTKPHSSPESVDRPRKRKRSNPPSEAHDVKFPAQHLQEKHVDLGRGLIVSVLAHEHDEGPNIWDALHRSRIADPFTAFENESPVFPETFDRRRTLDLSFPSLDEALRLCDIGFHTCYRLHEAIKREDFFRHTAILYDTSREEDDFPYVDQCSLLAAVIGLANALDAEDHHIVGCGSALSKGLYYIRLARRHLHIIDNSVATVTQLRTVVAIALFQLFTSNAWLASPFLSIACKTTVNIGLHARFSNDQTQYKGEDENDPMQNLYWTVLYLDAYICGLLGQKPFFDLSGAKKATLAVMQHVAKNSRELVRSSQELLLNIGLALSIELFDIQRRIADVPLHDVSSKRTRDAVMVNIRALETELDDFKAICDAIFPVGEVVNVVARTRFELLMGFCVTCLMLAMQRRQLMTKSRLGFSSEGEGATAKRYSRDAAAILAIDTASEYNKLPEHAPFSEPAAYALFICTLSLTTRMSVTTLGKERPHFANRILEGFFLMTRIACPRFAATPVYLHYIYKLGYRNGAIPGTGQDVKNGPSVASPIAVGNIPPRLEPDLNFDIGWSSLPDELQIDEDLLLIPARHAVPQAHVAPASELPARSDRSSSAATTSAASRSASTATSSSYLSSQSFSSPSLFSYQSSSTSASTPSSSAGITPFNDRRPPSMGTIFPPIKPHRKGYKSVTQSGTVFDR